MTAHSSILVWRMLWTEEPGGLQSMRSRRVDMTEQLTLSYFISVTSSKSSDPGHRPRVFSLAAYSVSELEHSLKLSGS